MNVQTFLTYFNSYNITFQSILYNFYYYDLEFGEKSHNIEIVFEKLYRGRKKEPTSQWFWTLTSAIKELFSVIYG